MEDRWNENFDVVLANPPLYESERRHTTTQRNLFASKPLRSAVCGPHSRTPEPQGKGRNHLLPEGVIFQRNGYKALRNDLETDYLYAVVSLPAGVF